MVVVQIIVVLVSNKHEEGKIPNSQASKEAEREGRIAVIVTIVVRIMKKSVMESRKTKWVK